MDARTSRGGSRLLSSGRWPATVRIVEAQIAEGDPVVTRLRGRATFLGECLGVKPNGKMVEHWAHADMAGFMDQLVAEPSSRE